MKKTMIKPDSLRRNDRVMIVSPASSVFPGYVEGAENVLSSWGLEPVRGRYCVAATKGYAGTVEERLADLRTALTDDSVAAVLCSRGGYGTVHLLEHLRPEWFSSRPKWIIGFSDISALHAASLSAGVMSLHAPMCKHLSETPENEASRFLRAILFGENPVYRVDAHRLNRQGRARGRLVGGNMAVLCALLRTPYDLFAPGTVLFIEDIAEPPYKIERMLYNLRLAGVLAGLSGLIVGRFTEYEESPTHPLYEQIGALVADYDYPVCFDFPVGHVPENYPMIEGADVELDVNVSGVSLAFR